MQTIGTVWECRLALHGVDRVPTACLVELVTHFISRDDARSRVECPSTVSARLITTVAGVAEDPRLPIVIDVRDRIAWKT